MLPMYPRDDRRTSEIRRNGGVSDFYRVHSRVTQFTPCVRGLPAQRRTSSLLFFRRFAGRVAWAARVLGPCVFAGDAFCDCYVR